MSPRVLPGAPTHWQWHCAPPEVCWRNVSRLGPGIWLTLLHCWDDGAQYLAACTDEGHIIVKRIGLEVEFETQIDDKVFVNVNLCKLGLVAASMDGWFYFFEHIDDHGVKEFKNIRRW